MFYLTLPSNSSLDYFPDNTLTHYWTKLPQAVDLSGGEWEVGLTEIQYPHTWYNIQDGRAWTELNIDGVAYDGVLKAGFYESPNILVKRMKLLCGSFIKDCTAVELHYDSITQKVTISVKPRASVKFSPLLQILLGLSHAEYGPGTHEGNNVVDIRQGFYSLYVYCNLSEPHMVGDALVPLLRIVPIRGKDGDLITRTYENVNYHPVQQRRFDVVELDIRDDTGRKVSFERGKVVVTLHFRRRRSSHFL